jgi:PEP-CTERM motif
MKPQTLKNKIFGFGLAAALGAFATLQTASAQTGSLSMSGYAYPSALSFSVTGHSSVGAGGFNASYDPAGPVAPRSFVAYCIDLAQTFSWNRAFTATETNVESLFGAFRAGALDRLYTQRFAGATNPTLSAAFQLAVWEIITETNASTYSALDLDTGSFRVTLGNSNARGIAEDWLQSLGSGRFGGYQLTALVGPNNQDQMMATPVPEPETYMMLLAGLGLMAFAANRRRERNSLGIAA